MIIGQVIALDFNAALNVVQTCFLAYLAARYSPPHPPPPPPPAERRANEPEA